MVALTVHVAGRQSRQLIDKRSNLIVALGKQLAVRNEVLVFSAMERWVKLVAKQSWRRKEREHDVVFTLTSRETRVASSGEETFRAELSQCGSSQ
jgi:hypothetical protein